MTSTGRCILVILKMKTEEIELTPIEKEIDSLLRQSGYFIHAYRSIEALNFLQKAKELMAQNEVKWQVKSAVYRNLGQANIQMGHHEKGLKYMSDAYDCTEDGNDKAALAGMLGMYYLESGKQQEALEFADKALQTATAPELKSSPYQIQGAIANSEGDYPKAIELMTKAAEFAEEAHSYSDLAMIIMDISVVFMNMGKPETALSEIHRAERYVKECHNLDLYVRCAIREANILYKMGKEQEAKALIIALDSQKN